LHIRKHGGAPAKSLAALGSSRDACERLAGLGDPGLEASVASVLSSAPERRGAGAETLVPMSVGASSSAGHRFRILRLHALGGLGAVFVAMDEELHREVALKEIQDRHADDPVSRTRFVLEAEITGALEHPGIVPVYGLGRHSDGRPFYAMRLIRGDSLKDAIAAFHSDSALQQNPGTRSLELRKLLGRFLDVCDAVEYAHRRGVLHRDLKPGNVMVGRYGETLVVDWGLAKAVGRDDPARAREEMTFVPNAASGSAETRAGSAVGTPAFMSPEQAAGDLDQLGAPSDVYSLGATLYCLLTGRPPFEGSDLEAVLWAVRRGEFPPPRQLDRSIDPALDAVCLKAMAQKPEERYESPKMLAEDIERWMADEPVSAWREPISRRAARWMRRHRTAVTASAAAALMALVGLSAVLLVKARDNVNLRAAYGREHLANLALLAANEREKARFDLAMEAIQTFHTGVSTDVLLKRKEFAELRGKLLGGARVFYDKLKDLLESQTDRRSRDALAEAYSEVGRLVSAIGSKRDALTAYEQARAIREKLVAADPTSRYDRDKLAGNLNNLGNLLRETDRRAEALAAYDRALAIEQALVNEYPQVEAYREQLGRILNNMSLQHRAAGHPTEALDLLDRSRATREALVAEHPSVALYRYDLAVCLTNLGFFFQQSGRLTDALTTWRNACGVLETLVREAPSDHAYRSALAINLNNLASLNLANGQSAEALADWSRARELFEGLVRDYPNETINQNRLAGCLLNIGVLLHKSGRSSEALAAYNEAKAHYESLVQSDPSSTVARQDLALCFNNLGSFWKDNGRLDEALAAFERARVIREGLAREDPSSVDDRHNLAIAVNGQGGVHREAGRTTQALASYDQACRLWKALAKEQPGVPEYQNRLAHALGDASGVLASTGRIREAISSLRRAADLWSGLTTAHPDVLNYHLSLSSSLSELAGLLLKEGERKEAIETLGRLRDLLEKSVSMFPNDYEEPLRLASALQELGMMLKLDGRPADAAALLRRSISIREAISEIPPDALVDLARTRCQLGMLEAVPGSGVSGAERRRALDGAMGDLRRAIDRGYRDPVLASDPVLDALRSLPAFPYLLMDLGFPTDPFSSGPRPAASDDPEHQTRGKKTTAVLPPL
jgi:serine/threonine-protein kinase